MGYAAPKYAQLAKELSNQWWRPEEEGESLEGTFLGHDMSKSQFGPQPFFGFNTRDGEKRIGCNAGLVEAFDAAGIAVGDDVLVTYRGKQDGRARIFEVEKLRAGRGAAGPGRGRSGKVK